MHIFPQNLAVGRIGGWKMNAGPSKKSIRQQSVFVADLLDPDTSGWNDDDDDDDDDDNDDDDDGDDDDDDDDPALGLCRSPSPW